MSLVITSEPAAEPVTLDEAKSHLKVDVTDEDTLIESLITTARKHIEQLTWLQLISATYTLKMDCLPTGAIIVPRPPLQSVSSITYEDENDATQTLATSEYTVDASSFPGRIVPAFGESWPATLGHINDVTVAYIAGYGDSGTSVPGPLKHAILMLTEYLHKNRSGGCGIPMFVEAMALSFACHDHRLTRYL